VGFTPLDTTIVCSASLTVVLCAWICTPLLFALWLFNLRVV